MAGLYEMLMKGRPKSAAEELANPNPGGLGGKIATVDLEKIRPGFSQYKADGGEMSWEEYVDHWKKNGDVPDAPQ